MSFLSRVAKTASWRAVSLAETFAVCWLVTGETKAAGAIALVAGIISSALYFGHEALWERFRFARVRA